jgi:hypothetical protein
MGQGFEPILANDFNYSPERALLSFLRVIEGEKTAIVS